MKRINTEKGYKIEIDFPETGYNDNLQPYKNEFYHGKKCFEVEGKYVAEVEYGKREGGTYIYSNNPEMLAPEDIGQAIIRTEGLTGLCNFTYEHSNHTGTPVYFGYQLKNEGTGDVTVTVTNLGFQPEGEWLGQRSWSDYFNYRFELPFDYFLENGETNPIYIGCDYVDYTPTPRAPQKFIIPAGEYIYVLGGTTQDAFNHTNVFGSADIPIKVGKCSNAVVRFIVEGGSVTGTFYVYQNPEQVKANPKEQGFITERFNSARGEVLDYSKQYKGVDPTAGLIESNITLIVDDETECGRLPIRYTKYHDPDYASKNTPYAKYDLVPKVIEGDRWVTALNPNDVPLAIGTDMMIFKCVDTDGKDIVIDTEGADSSGAPANIGNWMIQYTDNFTLINAGEKEREFTFFKRGNNGVLFVMARDESGDILSASALTAPYSFDNENCIFDGVDRSLLVEKNGRLYFKVADGRPFCDCLDERSEVIRVAVPPMSYDRISIDYVILGNSCGGTTHWVEVE